ncbi:MAG: zinc ribbon domain-containing protein [Oscillospiraceae bacterium]|nr:zinc ribbon domain-containing protein [Oscillospiraceae bacterium]
MKCSQCGRNIPNTAKFCRYCGARAAAPQRSPAPTGRPQQRSRRQQSGVNGFLILRIILIVICVGLVGVGVWKIPGNVRKIIASHSHPKKETSAGTPAVQQTPAETLSPSEAEALHEAIEQINAQNDALHPDAEEEETYVDPTISEEEAARNYYHELGKSWFRTDPTEAEEVTAP